MCWCVEACIMRANEWTYMQSDENASNIMKMRMKTHWKWACLQWQRAHVHEYNNMSVTTMKIGMLTMATSNCAWLQQKMSVTTMIMGMITIRMSMNAMITSWTLDVCTRFKNRSVNNVASWIGLVVSKHNGSCVVTNRLTMIPCRSLSLCQLPPGSWRVTYAELL